MQDVVDECGISRGGIYIYFASVDEIFFEVIRRRNKERYSVISKVVQDAEPFTQVLDGYLAKQKNRLLNFEGSLFRAYCEFVFSKPKPAAKAFSDVQLGHLRKTITSILNLGASQGFVDRERICELVNHFIVVIDGLGVMALGGALTEEILESQLNLLKSCIM